MVECGMRNAECGMKVKAVVLHRHPLPPLAKSYSISSNASLIFGNVQPRFQDLYAAARRLRVG